MEKPKEVRRQPANGPQPDTPAKVVAPDVLSEVQFREEDGRKVAVLPYQLYIALLDDLEALQDSVDALNVKLRIASGETEVSDWKSFLAEFDGLPDQD
jgi:hypothetical protein